MFKSSGTYICVSKFVIRANLVVRLGAILDQFCFERLGVFRAFSEMCIVLPLVFAVPRNIVRSVKRHKTTNIYMKN